MHSWVLIKVPRALNNRAGQVVDIDAKSMGVVKV
jgi:hypothetical protein